MKLGKGFWLLRQSDLDPSTLRFDSTLERPGATRSMLIMSRIKETLRKKFADLANDFEHRLQIISSQLASIEGPLEVGRHQL